MPNSIVKYFEDIVNESLESLRSIKELSAERIRDQRLPKLKANRILTNFKGMTIIDLDLVLKKIQKLPRTKQFAKIKKIPATWVENIPPSTYRRILNELIDFMQLKKEETLFFHRFEKDFWSVFFFSGNKIIETTINGKQNLLKEISQQKVCSVGFSEAGRSEKAYSDVLGGGATDTLKKVIISLLYHEVKTSYQWAYAFWGSKKEGENVKEADSKEYTQRDRIYLNISKLISRKAKMNLYLYEHIANQKRTRYFLITRRKLKEFSKMKGAVLSLIKD